MSGEELGDVIKRIECLREDLCDVTDQYSSSRMSGECCQDAKKNGAALWGVQCLGPFSLTVVTHLQYSLCTNT